MGSINCAFLTSTLAPAGDRIEALDSLMGEQFEPYSDQPLVQDRFAEAKKQLLSVLLAE